jgi:hypothetical protein
VRNEACSRESTHRGEEEKGGGGEREGQVQSFVLWPPGVGKEGLHRSTSGDIAPVPHGARFRGSSDDGT